MRLLKACVLMIVGCLACRASDDTLARGVPGTYQRSDGMRDEALTLNADGSYVFVTRFDIGSDKESGVWSVRDGAVILKVRRKGEVFKRKPAHFLILAIDGDLVLRVQDDGIGPEDEQDPRAVFRRQKKQAQPSGRHNARKVTVIRMAQLRSASPVSGRPRCDLYRACLTFKDR